MKKYVLFFLLGSFALASQAQILDDSTKLVYGPNTTKYIKEKNILYNDLIFTVIDTSSINTHRWSKLEKSEYRMTNLGVSGTAIRNIFFEIPYLIGARSGYSAYVPYHKSTRDFKYYDTKSPYSKIGAAIGGKNRTYIDVGFNRSDSSSFNIGLDYFNTSSDKQVNSRGKNDRLLKNEGFDAYLVYFTPNRKYLVMGNFSRIKVVATEQGGINKSNSPRGFFNSNAKVFLNNANSEYLKRTYHLYHQFTFKKALQGYQILNHSYDKTKFFNKNLSEDLGYFGTPYLNKNATKDSTQFETISIKNGIKGDVGSLFYSAYYKYRIYTFTYGTGDSDTLNFKTTKPSQDGIEHYLGGRVRYKFNPYYQLYGGVDFNLSGNRKLWGKIKFKGLQANIFSQKYKATFMERGYLGNHDYWINDFKTIKAIQVDANYTQKIAKKLTIKPTLRFTSFTDYVYYNKKAKPTQLNSTNNILTLGAKLSTNPFANLFIEAEGLYSTVSGEDSHAFPLPTLMGNLNIYLHGIHFNGNLDWQIGLDNHWKSDYFALDYRVSTNQFFVQDQFNIPSFLISDFYINTKLGRAFVFFKINNLVDLFAKKTYFAAPNYIGKRFLIDYGFYWMFFD